MINQSKQLEYFSKVKDLINSHGWAIQAVMAHSPVTYTVGLSLQGYPELAFAGLPAEVAQPLLNKLAKQLASGELELVENLGYPE